MERKYNEKIIIRSGKLQYAIQLDEEKSRNHIIIENGKVYFTDSWYSDAVTFNFNDDAHRIAKEIFITQLQTDIKSKIAELRLLDSSAMWVLATCRSFAILASRSMISWSSTSRSLAFWSS